jgi:dTDP-4-dehydrorhamnose reductase
MKILITGSKGQVGQFLTQKLTSQSNVNLLAVDRESLDITDKKAVFAIVEKFQPDYIINAAAHTAVDKAETEVELSYLINRDGPQYLAEAAQSINAAMLHISTDYVFPGNKNGAYLEDDVTGPQGVYGQSKLAGEIAVATSCNKHIILRTAWVFSELGNNFVKTMLKLGAMRSELSIIGDQFGGPTYAGDIADTLIHIVNKCQQDNQFASGIYHFSGFPHVSWFEFADTIFNIAVQTNALESKPKIYNITTDQYPTPASRPENSKMDCSKIFHTFGIEQSNWKLALKNIKEYTQ